RIRPLRKPGQKYFRPYGTQSRIATLSYNQGESVVDSSKGLIQ
ncbi:unnamed protein product, partial [marine sediment metagenome]